ncbi:thiol peroxidase [Guyparkeria halophila]|uniref:Thiol peroxidase n=1 Tax=Guyparkeria halophila TaxID=47960 RepID=A0ABZ0YTV8_9GAMM|nr:thiol peroxidase [Guyparkeria halophila]WQH15597.1 thiol peroxidase [Guyparkeria halophila]
MSQVTFKGTPVNVAGTLPSVGEKAPAFSLTASDLSDKGLDAFAGKKKVLNIFPSLDTGTCAKSVREFNRRAGEHGDAVVLGISMDLPFAQARFAEAEGIDNIAMLSAFRHPEFLDDYGLRIADGPLAGLAARTVVVLDADNTVRHVELVDEIADQPDYEAALGAL